MIEGPHTHYAESRSGRVAYRAAGSGPLDVLGVVHAFIPVDLMWDEPTLASCLDRLSGFSRHIWFDQRNAVRTLGLDVRVGVHTGEVMLRGRDIGGIAVHIGQRIQAAAEPGEVLVSRTVVDLVAGSHLRFEDRGEQPLEGVPGLWRLFAAEDQPIGR